MESKYIEFGQIRMLFVNIISKVNTEKLILTCGTCKKVINTLKWITFFLIEWEKKQSIVQMA